MCKNLFVESKGGETRQLQKQEVGCLIAWVHLGRPLCPYVWSDTSGCRSEGYFLEGINVET